MAGRCSICQHQRREEIDTLLVSGVPYRNIVEHYHVSKPALSRHASEHIPATISQAQDARDAAHALDIVQQLKLVNTAALAVLTSARASGDHALVLRATDRVLKQVELQAKLLGELGDTSVTATAEVNILVNPGWVQLRTIILQALEPYPEARRAVAAGVKRYIAERHGTPGGYLQ